ncbi:MAG: hypothetical protein BJ554DRAFT_658 [Olpidium bornovanus]|uniref:Uncharacterized protein n=1 Tax=Olpidium bornovanus TaxID=278681 RepID=A0A8H7ZTF5_9FUNG|nr:MAG: hypothetical protein BJ554DRAFT_658 [Olpidium bornovanus]
MKVRHAGAKRRRLAGLALGSLAWAAACASGRAAAAAAAAASYTAKRVRYSAPDVDLPAPPPPSAEIPVRHNENESAFTELGGPSEMFLVDVELASSILDDDSGAPTFARVYPLALDLRSSEISVLGSTACENLDVDAKCFEEIKYHYNLD